MRLRPMSLGRHIMAFELSTIVNKHMTIHFTSENNKKSYFNDTMSNIEHYRVTKGLEIAVRRSPERKNGYLNYFASSTKDDPIVFSGLSSSTSTGGLVDEICTTENSLGSILGPNKIKEIVIPCSNDMSEVHSALRALGARPHGRGNIPELYQLELSPNDCSDNEESDCSGDNGEHFAVRLAPIQRVCVVLKVDSISKAIESLVQWDMKYEKVGGRVSYEGLEDSNRPIVKDEEIHLLSSPFSFLRHDKKGASTSDISIPLSDGSGQVDLDFISIRLSKSDHVKSFFNEESASITQGTIKEIQSERLFGGDGSVRESKFGFAGDCWAEAHAMAREKIKAFLRRPFTSGVKGKAMKSPRVSKLPSIRE